MNSSIVVTSTDTNNKTITKTITNVNPDADNDKLATWGQMLTALTDNTYTKTDRVDKANCDTAPSKQTATLTLSPTSVTAATMNQGSTQNITYTYNGDASTIQFGTPNTGIAYSIQSKNNNTFAIKQVDQSMTVTAGELIISFPETDNYKAVSATFTIT